MKNKRREILIRRLLLVSWILLLAFLNLYHFPDDCNIGSHGKDKLGHFVISGMGFSIAYLNSFSYWKSSVFVWGYSLFLECLQYYIPWRSFELMDLAADLLGIIAGVIFMFFYSKKYKLEKEEEDA